MVMEFKYLGRVLTKSGDDWLEVVGNIQKARSICSRFSRILGLEGTYPRTSDSFYKMVVQATLLFGSET